MYMRVDNLEVVGYTNSNLGGCPNNRKSTSGFIFMMARGAISWKNKKQTLVASYTMQAEFISCYVVATHVVWLRNFVTGLRIVDSIARPLRIFCVNKIAVFYTENNKISSGYKHLELKYMTVIDLVKDSSMVVEHMHTDSMLANPLTNRLRSIAFIRHVENMGILSSFDMLCKWELWIYVISFYVVDSLF